MRRGSPVVRRIVLMNAGQIEADGAGAGLRRSSILPRRLREIQCRREGA